MFKGTKCLGGVMIAKKVLALGMLTVIIDYRKRLCLGPVE